MSVLETKIERKVVKDAYRKWGLKLIKMKKLGENGFPDRLALLPVTPIWIEFKVPGNEPEPLQLHQHEYLRKLGYEVWVEDNAEECLKKLEYALHSRDWRRLATAAVYEEGC